MPCFLWQGSNQNSKERRQIMQAKTWAEFTNYQYLRSLYQMDLIPINPQEDLSKDFHMLAPRNHSSMIFSADILSGGEFKTHRIAVYNVSFNGPSVIGVTKAIEERDHWKVVRLVQAILSSDCNSALYDYIEKNTQNEFF
jgi:hypothetical protein